MDIKALQAKVIEAVKSAWILFKEILELPRAKLYLLIAAAMTLLFVVFTFPYDILVRNNIKALEKVTGGTINLGQLDFSLWRNTYIDSVAVYFADGTELSLKDVNVDFTKNPISLFLLNRFSGDFKVNSLKYQKKDMSIEGVVKVLMSSAFDTKKDIITSGSLSIALQNINVKGIEIKGFVIPPIKFSGIAAEAKIANNQLRIDRCVFSGVDLRGQITGTIALNKMMKSSRLNLKIEIDGNSRVLEDYKILLGSLTGSDGEKIRLDVGGMLHSPEVNFPQKTEAPPQKAKPGAEPDDDDEAPRQAPGPGKRPPVDTKKTI
ncbi:MAG TPA: type II secretion system protein GspN [Spirochaetota bacterium]|nr:type II secretion system protein GspN [Spirochaetota bacterium]HNT10684.1 type II secretion system protein GspN [Spirochaetota bacterium]HOS40608.1 type II secretion system protein GspN [Spirochaetota bacterium]